MVKEDIVIQDPDEKDYKEKEITPTKPTDGTQVNLIIASGTSLIPLAKPKRNSKKNNSALNRINSRRINRRKRLLETTITSS